MNSLAHRLTVFSLIGFFILAMGVTDKAFFLIFISFYRCSWVKMLYFAYGSNLDCAQMKTRCSSARFICKAVLKDHRLAFTRQSKKRQCGVADVVPAKGQNTWGVVYEIDEKDIGKLDNEEGYKPDRPLEKNSYVRAERVVFDEKDNQLTVSIYIANRQEGDHYPNQEYKDFIVNGAKYWQLPDWYVEMLKNIDIG